MNSTIPVPPASPPRTSPLRPELPSEPGTYIVKLPAGNFIVADYVMVSDVPWLACCNPHDIGMPAFISTVKSHDKDVPESGGVIEGLLWARYNPPVEGWSEWPGTTGLYVMRSGPYMQIGPQPEPRRELMSRMNQTHPPRRRSSYTLVVSDGDGKVRHPFTRHEIDTHPIFHPLVFTPFEAPTHANHPEIPDGSSAGDDRG